MELDEAYNEFWDSLRLDASASHEPISSCFFQRYAAVATDNGDCGDLAYTPALMEEGHGLRIDGFALDEERGELHVAVCDFRTEPLLQSLNQAAIEQHFRKAERFVTAATKQDFINALEETSPAFQAAQPIFALWSSISRVRMVLFSNARLASRKKGVEAREINGKTFTYNLLDFNRYNDILSAHGNVEPIEIALEEAVPCLKADASSGKYSSYLIAMPGEVLASIYGLYGARLLEQNVRTFLQARTKVNQGIIETLSSAPEMFFAYNNGLTATASHVATRPMPGGGEGIFAFTNLQIVNGGQTTASVLYAKDHEKADLSSVYVQMKLTVLKPSEIEEVVPRISRFANTQNRISEADFFSSHPFHIQMEKTSRSQPAPQRAAAFTSTKWFYERARGQYRDKMAYGTATQRKRFLAEFPRDQVIEKTDLAKTELTFECEPHIVSQGSQKCFLRFAERISERWAAAPENFGPNYFKDAVAKTIVFRWTDSMIASSDWYKADRGYKAQTTTFTIAWLLTYLADRKLHVDLQQIWKSQDVGGGLRQALETVAPEIAAAIRVTPPEIKNVGEFCKRQACWASVSRLRIEIGGDLDQFTIGGEELNDRGREARADNRLNAEVELDLILHQLVPVAEEIRDKASERNFLSPQSASALSKLANGRLQLTRSEKNALKYLLARLDEVGYRVPTE